MDDEGRERFLKVSRDIFSSRLREQIRWLAEKCWIENLKPGLRDLGEIIDAAHSLGVTQASSFNEEELDKLTVKLRGLRVEDKFLEAEQLLLEAVSGGGVPREVLGLQ